MSPAKTHIDTPNFLKNAFYCCVNVLLGKAARNVVEMTKGMGCYFA